MFLPSIFSVQVSKCKKTERNTVKIVSSFQKISSKHPLKKNISVQHSSAVGFIVCKMVGQK